MAHAKKKGSKKGKKGMPPALAKYWREHGRKVKSAKPKAKKGSAKKSRAGKGREKLSGATVSERLHGLEKRVQGLEVSEAQNYRLFTGMVNAWRKSKGLKAYDKLPGMRVPRLYSSEAARGVKVAKLFGSGR